MSGSSNRTNPMPSFCHPSSTLPTLSTRLLLLGATGRCAFARRPSRQSREGAEPADSSIVACSGGATGGSLAGRPRGTLRTATRPRRAGRSSTRRGGRVTRGLIESSQTHVLPLEFERAYPVVVRGDGVWVEDARGNRYLDAMSGGSMAATLGHGRDDLVAAARAQAERLAYVHNERLTNPAQERLAEELVDVAPEGFSRVRFVASGSDANEMA